MTTDAHWPDEPHAQTLSRQDRDVVEIWRDVGGWYRWRLWRKGQIIGHCPDFGVWKLEHARKAASYYGPQCSYVENIRTLTKPRTTWYRGL